MGVLQPLENLLWSLWVWLIRPHSLIVGGRFLTKAWIGWRLNGFLSSPHNADPNLPRGASANKKRTSLMMSNLYLVFYLLLPQPSYRYLNFPFFVCLRNLMKVWVCFWITLSKFQFQMCGKVAPEKGNNSSELFCTLPSTQLSLNINNVGIAGKFLKYLEFHCILIDSCSVLIKVWFAMLSNSLSRDCAKLSVERMSAKNHRD